MKYLKESGWNENTFPEINEEKSLLLIFASPSFDEDQKILTELREKYPNTPCMGCSSSGEIFQNEVNDDSLSVAIVEFADASVKVFTKPIESGEHSFETGKLLAEELIKGTKLKGVFVLSDGLNVNGSELVNGINSILPNDVIITGGLAGDGPRFEKTWILDANGCKSHKVVAAGFYGESVVFTHGSQGGWDIFGPERKVTKSEGNVLYEIDDEPALDLYEKYLGDMASELPASALLFPLQIRADENVEKKLVRTVLSIDSEKKTMTFAGDIPNGHLVQLMRANFDRLIDGASAAAVKAKAKAKVLESNEPLLALAVSCVGRRLVLGERIEEEVEATLSSLPENTVQIGFYSYGELSPYVDGKPCELHNQTMTLTTIGEKKVA